MNFNVLMFLLKIIDPTNNGFLFIYLNKNKLNKKISCSL